MPEPVRFEYDSSSDSITSKEVRTSEQFFSLPSVLRGAAYISSGGRIYRLFSDGDETSFQLASFGELFRFDPLPELQPLENLPLPAPISSESSIHSIETLPELRPLENLSLPTESKSESSMKHSISFAESQTESLKNSFVEVFEQKGLAKNEKTSSILPIRRPLAVNEPTTSISVSKADSISTTIKNTQKISTVNSSATLLKTVSSLELFEAIPKTVLSETVSTSTILEQKTLPQQKPSVVPFTQTPHVIAQKESNDVAKTPVVQIIRLEIHQSRKPKRPFSVRELPLSKPDKQELQELNPANFEMESVSDNTEPIVTPVTTPIEQTVAPIVAKTEIHVEFETVKNNENIIVAEHVETETVETETITTETYDDEFVKNVSKNKILVTKENDNQVVQDSIEVVAEDIDIPVPLPATEQVDAKATTTMVNESNTLIFPQRESVLHLSTSSKLSQKHQTWQLAWQPHWPEHLQSLELTASDQICFLADHLEMLHERGRKVISFNSFRPGDGCTTLALCAARELAERGYRLLLADAHQRNPELPQLLRLNTDPHLYEIITLIQDHLELLPWTETAIEITSPNVLYTQSFAEIVGSFRNDYDFILLDNGSLIEYPLTERVIQWQEMCSDGVLLVLNMKVPAPINVRDIAHRLRQYHIELLGVAENYV